MKIKTFDIGTWLFPDSEIDANCRSVSLVAPRNSDACFQIFTDLTVREGAYVSWSATSAADGIGIRVEQLCPVLVSHNSDTQCFESLNYEEVKDFVVRKAPYEVFDRVRPICDGILSAGKLAFFVRIDVKKDVVPGDYDITLSFVVEGKCFDITVSLRVYQVLLHDTNVSPFQMCHWIYPDILARVHNTERGSEKYYRFFEDYLSDLYDMRNNYFQLPTAIAVKDPQGRIVGFDFSECDRIAKICQEIGFPVIFGGFVTRFKKWDDPDYYLLWDMDVATESAEGYRQLKLYFEGVNQFVKRNGLEGRYMQGLVDEPQIPNSLAYKAICCTFRTLVPGVKIIDPVETPYIPGSCDIWVIKQAVYEKYKEEYQKLAALGEEFWVYSCGFPANKWMNHVLDIPLSATRLITWMAVAYGMTGFLHYGYNSFHEGMDTMYETNAPVQFTDVLRYYPAGNHALIYAKEDHFYGSVRSHVQRTGAAEAELLMRLRQKDEALCNRLIEQVCTDFVTYTTDSCLVESCRRQLLETLAQLDA